MALQLGFGFRSRWRFSLLLCLVAAACQNKTPEPSAGASEPASPLFPPSPRQPPAAPVTTPAAPAASAAQEPLHVTWVDPPAFKRVPPSNPMRKASFIVPRADG